MCLCLGCRDVVHSSHMCYLWPGYLAKKQKTTCLWTCTLDNSTKSCHFAVACCVALWSFAHMCSEWSLWKKMLPLLTDMCNHSEIVTVFKVCSFTVQSLCPSHPSLVCLLQACGRCRQFSKGQCLKCMHEALCQDVLSSQIWITLASNHTEGLTGQQRRTAWVCCFTWGSVFHFWEFKQSTRQIIPYSWR